MHCLLRFETEISSYGAVMWNAVVKIEIFVHIVDILHVVIRTA